MVAQDVTEAAELGGALVGEAELECARGRHGIQRLQPRIVAQDVQHAAVRLPQELEPGRHLLPVCAVLRTIDACFITRVRECPDLYLDFTTWSA